MTLNQATNQFIERLLSIEPPAQNLFGRGIPGMLGASGGANQAAGTSATDVVMSLRQQALSLRRLLSDGGDPGECPKAIEGSLLTLSVLDAITQREVDGLIDELYDVTGQPS